jgi:uncharacterized protein (TIGR00255 family)
MIKSMTAFSQFCYTGGTITADVTIRSYNSRHLDMVFYCPESCQTFEEDVKKIITKLHQRGRIEIRLSIEDQEKDQNLFEVDSPRVSAYFKALSQIKTDLELSDDISMNHILSEKHMIVPSKKEQDTQKVWAVVAPAIEGASLALDQMRKKEGSNLYADLLSRIDYIQTQLAGIEKEARAIPEVYKKRLMDRIDRLTADTDMIDPVRMAQEAAIIADKSDVSEEIVRVHSHIKLFKETMDSELSQGRKLNFMIQEFNREFNTIGSKAGNAVLSHQVVDLKSELEKIREQVQNIE